MDDGDLPVPVAVEDTGVEKFELRLVAVAAGVLVDETLVRKGGLRVVVAPAHPGVCRRRVQVPPVLLDVLAVVPLRVGEAEGPFLEDGVHAVPEGERQAEALLDVADAGHAVLVPAIRPRARLVVRKAVPGVAVGAVVLTHRSPAALAQVRAPAPPARRPGIRLREPGALGGGAGGDGHRRSLSGVGGPTRLR